MEEKELVRRVRNSFKAKKSRAEILQGFQKRGYKLAYAEELIKKAVRPKRITATLLVSILLFFSLTSLGFTLFASQEKLELENPLASFSFSEKQEKSIIEETTSEVLIKATKETTNTQSSKETSENETITEEISTYDEIEITPEFITFLLNEVGAWKLHKNPITFTSPVMNFDIEGEVFTSTITQEIETIEGLSDSPDLTFNVNRKDLIDAILSEDSKSVFVESISAGRSSVDIIAPEAELFAKGYLDLYNTLNPN